MNQSIVPIPKTHAHTQVFYLLDPPGAPLAGEFLANILE